VIQGTVIKAAGNLYSVRSENGIISDCHIKGNLRVKGIRSTNPVTIGDKVTYILNNKIGTILKIEDRRNYIVRRASNLSKLYHIIASNIDQAILIITITQPETNTDFIDRYLVAAESFRIPAILVFNKIDLCLGEFQKKYDDLLAIYTKIGYLCIATSIKDNLNLDLFEGLLKNKISVINGNSGVGKSSLIKSVCPELNIKIGSISEYHHKGVHTTSYSEMYEINPNSYIIDTPGIRGFGLIDFYKEELYHYFPEIFKISSECKFYNCTHIHEPGCMVIEALRNNIIAASRYFSYMNIFNDKGQKYRY